MTRLSDRIDRWLTIEQPVTYWSFWEALLRLVPFFLAMFALVAVATDVRFAFYSFAPLPFVFVAATVGYAVRDLNVTELVVSHLVAAVYGFLLWLSGTAGALLQRPTPVLSVIAVLAFVAMIAGFSSSTLHGRQEDDEFTRAYREHRSDDEE